ncbi:hypothetical protein H5410_021910 [Solanum commersonii]|uniref:NB-ARC domain containing protein n=1 Tax=Solanum commersonii TaxID=4109 RepID=A0A9J5ZDW1_SOLCO|nr:hypothetical protein H5410_021910 [Solanum commersonii]
MAATTTRRPSFEVVRPAPPPQTTTYATLFNSNTINPKQFSLINSKTLVKSVEIIHGEPTITFSMKGKSRLYDRRWITSSTVVEIIPWCTRFEDIKNLSPGLFAKKSMLSIASTVGKPISIDKATQIKSRPSTARVKVILNLMEKSPNRLRLQFVDGKSGKLIEKRDQNNKQIDDTIEVSLKGTTDTEKYQVDAREILNEKRKIVDVDESTTTSLDQKLAASTSKKNCVDSMDVDTSNIGAQTTTENKGDCNNQHAATNEVQSKKVGLNLMSNATKNARGTPRVEVDAPRVGSGKKIMDSGEKLMDTSDVEDAENFGQHVLQFENENPTKNWTLGPTGNFHESEKKQDTSNASRDLLCSNSFDALLKPTGKQVRLTENDNDLIQEKQVLPHALNRKLCPEDPVFVPICVLAKKNESRVLVSNTIDLGKDSLDKDGVDLGEDSLDEDGVDLGEDSLDEDEEDNMLGICFDRVARERDISPRQQRSGSNKRKKKSHGMQHSWTVK